MSNNAKHDWLVNKIYYSPNLVGVDSEQVIARAQDYELLYKGHSLTIPDIYFILPDSAEYVEVKSQHNQYLYSKGMRQLEKVLDWHVKSGLAVPNAQMVMPREHRTKYWIDMLDNLVSYKPGEWFDEKK